MARSKKKKAIRRTKASAPTKTRRSGKSKSRSLIGGDFQGIAFAGIGFGILSRVVRSVLGQMESLKSVGNIIFPIVVMVINHRFFHNSYITVLAINELSQTIIRQSIPALSVNGDEEMYLYGDSLDEPFQVSGDALDEPYQISGDDYEDDDLAGIGMENPKDFEI